MEPEVVDLRTEGIRTSPDGHDVERFAATMISAVLSARVSITSGAMDLRIEQTGAVGVGEVIQDLDHEYGKIGRFTNKKESRIQSKDLSHQWWIFLRPGANLRYLSKRQANLIDLLNQVASTADLNRAVFPDEYMYDHRWGSELNDLGITHMYGYPVPEPDPGCADMVPPPVQVAGSVRFDQGGVAGIVPDDWSTFSDWLDIYLAGPGAGHVKKLAEFEDGREALDKHLVVIQTETTPATPFLALSFEAPTAPPTRMPNLPEAITHLWVVNSYAWRHTVLWVRDAGWQLAAP